MHFSVKLDCELGNPVVLYVHHSALLSAFQMYTAYTASKETLIGIGPELYAEQWISNYIVSSDKNFEDLILIYFVKILQASKK